MTWAVDYVYKKKKEVVLRQTDEAKNSGKGLY